MALEDLTGPNKFITALVNTNPLSADDRREGDDHIRGIKNVLHNTFPKLDGVVDLTPAELGKSKDAVQKTGDKMTGPLVLEATTLTLNSAAGADAQTLGAAVTAAEATLQAGKTGAAVVPPQMAFRGVAKYVFDGLLAAPGADYSARVKVPGGGPADSGVVVVGDQLVSTTHYAHLIQGDVGAGVFRLQAVNVPSTWAGFRMYADAYSPSAIDFRFGVAGGQIVLNGTGTIVQAARFAGKADTAGAADSATTAGSVASINGAAGGTVSSHIFVNGIVQCDDIRNTGDTSNWHWFWNVDSKFYAFVNGANCGWATLTSDGRIKQAVEPLELDVAGFMGIEPIRYRYRNIGIWRDDGVERWGFLAQNLEAVMRKAVVGSTSETYADPTTGEELPQAASVDDRVILAQAVLMIQELQRRVVHLEALAMGAE